MEYERIRDISVAFLVFLIIVLAFSFIGELLGETSSTGPIKIFSWVIGSVIAFKIFEVLSGEDKKNPLKKSLLKDRSIKKVLLKNSSIK